MKSSRVDVALESLDKGSWSKTTPSERLSILNEIRQNIWKYQDDLAQSEAAMKNGRMHETFYSTKDSKINTVPGVASNERDVDVSKLSASSFSFAGLVARGVCMPSLMTKEVSEAERCCCGCCCICC